MALANRYLVLYFTRGPMPTAEQLTDARQFGPHVMFRNAIFIREDDGCEPCTAVAGDVPRQYSRRYPAAVSYAEWLDGKLPTPEPEATAGEIALGVDMRSIRDRVLPDDAPSRPKRSQRGVPAAGLEPLSGMLGTGDTPEPEMPPRPAAGRSMTGDVSLPPPPPPPPQG